MPSHILHKPIHTGGLSDGCERCGEIAERPFENLDDENLAALIARTRAWLDDDEDAVARSSNEHRAMRIVETALMHRRALDRLEAEAA